MPLLSHLNVTQKSGIPNFYIIPELYILSSIVVLWYLYAKTLCILIISIYISTTELKRVSASNSY